MNFKKGIALMCAAAIGVSAIALGCNINAEAATTIVRSNTSTSVTSTKVPKYIFLFIGDGMSYPQVQLTNYYLSAMNDTNNNKKVESKSNLSFMNFPVAGSAQTYDSTSFCPDSASTATSISTGHKTYSGTINMDETKTVSYETISEKLKDQLGYKVGIITSVNLNHATPAAFYAHQASRNNYYEIGEELIDSDFDYFAGGGLLKTTGNDGTKENLYDLAKRSGYNVILTQKEAEQVTSGAGKTILIDEHLADSSAMKYELDRKDSEWGLADYVKKGIEVLDNDNGFFMMVEGGKIDWACHANDAASTISDTVALDDSVKEAIEFYNAHPDDTLILVTADHETGGLTVGFAGTNYDTFLTNLNNQKISYAKYDSDYVSKYKEKNTDFNTVLTDIQNLFGLVTPANAAQAKNETLVLTDYEVNKLKVAYDKTMAGSSEKLSQEEYVLYGSYQPLSVTITHILNNKSGVSFSSYSHTGLPVEVCAMGAGQDLFKGYYDNTNIYSNLAELTGVK
ncbi:Alkaline phosphatase 4 [bioreactor metagenome]|uniref:Alkaline phosphatase 4 n=1 Tax=bioreactor metagenome TaxID=1076179 RepID=A0A644YHW1_9ZZZZ